MDVQIRKQMFLLTFKHQVAKTTLNRQKMCEVERHRREHEVLQFGDAVVQEEDDGERFLGFLFC